MKLSIVSAVSWMALLSGVAANFDLYMVRQQVTLPDTGDSVHKRWQVFDAEPGSCDDVWGTSWGSSGDVSGTKTGVRCGGSGCDYKNPIENIDVLEMNFHGSNPVYHWTLYKDRGYTMVGLDGNTYGRCIPFPNGDFHCHSGPYTYRDGYRKFRCLTQFTASQLRTA